MFKTTIAAAIFLAMCLVVFSPVRAQSDQESASIAAASAGKMTLYMELYDSATGAKIGQVIDKQQARDNGHMSFSNSVTNRLGCKNA